MTLTLLEKVLWNDYYNQSKRWNGRSSGELGAWRRRRRRRDRASGGWRWIGWADTCRQWRRIADMTGPLAVPTRKSHTHACSRRPLEQAKTDPAIQSEACNARVSSSPSVSFLFLCHQCIALARSSRVDLVQWPFIACDLKLKPQYFPPAPFKTSYIKRYCI